MGVVCPKPHYCHKLHPRVFKIPKSLEEPGKYLHNEICFPETTTVVPIKGFVADLKEMNV